MKLPKRVKIDFNKLSVKCQKTPCGWLAYHSELDLDDAILEYLSNEYGFCVNSMTYKITFKKGVPTGFDVNVDWDTTE